jgi:hypothetical protein
MRASAAVAARAAALLTVLGAAFAAAGCGGNGGGTSGSPSGTTAPIGTTAPVGTDNPTGNLLLNPGFEEGPEPWISLAPDSGFTVSHDRALSGSSSAHLHMDDPVEAEGAKVYYLVQEINPAEFPEVVRGAYRVENWQKGTSKQYLQFVVIAIGPDNNPVPGAANYQLRYILAGIKEPPLNIGNAQFLAFSTEEPVTGQWFTFEANIRDDFQKLWRSVPEGYAKLRLLFEVRWDGKVAGDGAPSADVYYDDLYAGPQ